MSRSSVSGLAGIASFSLRRAPASALTSMATARCAAASLRVRRARTSSKPVSRSAKVRREQLVSAQ
jgi:hypothetical protein